MPSTCPSMSMTFKTYSSPDNVSATGNGSDSVGSTTPNNDDMEDTQDTMTSSSSSIFKVVSLVSYIFRSYVVLGIHETFA